MLTDNRRRVAVFALVAYLVDAALHLISHAFTSPAGEQIALTTVTQWLLMPLLFLALLSGRPAPRLRLVTLTLVALVFSWLGDMLPDFVGGGTASFLTMVGCFFLAQLAYIAAFRPLRGRGFMARHRVLVAIYLVCFLGLVMLCVPGAGGLLVPVTVYGGALTAMAILSVVLGRVGALGGALFFISDAMIAIGAFAPTSVVPHGSFLVMLTYITAQLLLVVAVLARSARGLVRASAVDRQDDVVNGGGNVRR